MHLLSFSGHKDTNDTKDSNERVATPGCDARIETSVFQLQVCFQLQEYFPFIMTIQASYLFVHSSNEIETPTIKNGIHSIWYQSILS